MANYIASIKAGLGKGVHKWKIRLSARCFPLSFNLKSKQFFSESAIFTLDDGKGYVFVTNSFVRFTFEITQNVVDGFRPNFQGRKIMDQVIL